MLMTFSGLFAIGLSGVNAHATSLEAISQNIANTQTTGYKRARVDFASLVTNLAPEGGIEGGGVRANARTVFSEQGAISRTGSPTDIAISGDGFFVVADSPDASATVSFTRSGGFSILEDGLLANEAGLILRGAPVDDNGNASVGSLSALEAININRIPGLAAATSEITFAGNLSSTAPTGSVLSQNVQIFDADGAARNLALTFTAAGAGAFDVVAAFTDGAQETVASGSLVFDASGRIDSASSSFPFAFSVNAGQSIDLNASSLTLGPGASQFTTASVDGAALGDLSGVAISRDGRVQAQFANGLSRDIYQIAIANFTNAEGLEQGESSTWSLTTQAGDVSLDIPQTGRAGAIESSALEVSAVDIGQEFSTLIETQRAYSANTQIITIADELWRTLTETAR
jgi:flagellar hook protein FlgE